MTGSSDIGALYSAYIVFISVFEQVGFGSYYTTIDPHHPD